MHDSGLAKPDLLGLPRELYHRIVVTRMSSSHEVWGGACVSNSRPHGILFLPNLSLVLAALWEATGQRSRHGEATL